MRVTVKMLLIFFCVWCSAATLGDKFDQVIDNQSNEIVKDKLKAFKEGGIEREIDMLDYKVEEAVDYAMTFRKVPHKMGGLDKDGIDCSGLVLVVHQKFGIELPHIAQEQARYGTVVSMADSLKRGDLVFFYDSYQSNNLITHTGIYLGNDDFIHASAQHGVMISKVNEPHYWGPRFLFGTRLKPLAH